MTESTDSNDLRKCPLCAEWIKKKAVFCKHCKTQLDADSQSVTSDQYISETNSIRSRTVPVVKIEQHSNKSSNIFVIVVASSLVLLALGAGAYWLTQNKSLNNSSKSADSRPENISDTKSETASPSAPTGADNPGNEIASTAEQEKKSDAPPASSAIDRTANPEALISRVLQAQQTSNQVACSDALSQLDKLPKPTIGNPEEGNRYNKIGLKDLKAKNFKAAALNFNLAHLESPSEAKFLSNLGFAEMNSGDYVSSRKHLYDSIALAPSRAIAWNDLGLVLAKIGEQDSAVSSLLIGYRLATDNGQNYLISLLADDDPSVRAAGNTALENTSNLSGGSETARNSPSATTMPLTPGVKTFASNAAPSQAPSVLPRSGSGSGMPTRMARSMANAQYGNDGVQDLPSLAPSTISMISGGGSGSGASNFAPLGSNGISVGGGEDNGGFVNSSNKATFPNDTDQKLGEPAHSNVDFAPYVSDMNRRIKRAWFPPRGQESNVIEVVFKIHSQGEVSDLRIEKSSGVESADQAALEAVRNASPLRPLPRGAEAVIDMKFKFDYSAFKNGRSF